MKMHSGVTSSMYATSTISEAKIDSTTDASEKPVSLIRASVLICRQHLPKPAACQTVTDNQSLIGASSINRESFHNVAAATANLVGCLQLYHFFTCPAFAA